MGGAEFVVSLKILRLSIIIITMYAAHFFQDIFRIQEY